jgi:hypothetical protein
MDNNNKTPQQLADEKKARETTENKAKDASTSKTEEKPPVTEPKKS